MIFLDLSGDQQHPTGQCNRFIFFLEPRTLWSVTNLSSNPPVSSHSESKRKAQGSRPIVMPSNLAIQLNLVTSGISAIQAKQ